MKRSVACIAVFSLGILLSPVASHANSDVPIGQLGITGQGFMLYESGAGTANAMSFIDWCPLNTGTPGAPTGNVTCGDSNTGLGFLTFSGGSGEFSTVGTVPGQIFDMTNVDPANSPYTTFAPGVTTSVPNFLVIDGQDQLHFTATSLQIASCTPSSTQACVGPLLLSEVGGSQTSVSMAILGTLVDSMDNSSAEWKAVVSGQFNEPMTDVEQQLASASGAFSDQVSGSLETMPWGTTSTPEPATMGLMMLGILLLGAAGVARSLRGMRGGETAA